MIRSVSAAGAVPITDTNEAFRISRSRARSYILEGKDHEIETLVLHPRERVLAIRNVDSPHEPEAREHRIRTVLRTGSVVGDQGSSLHQSVYLSG